MNEQNIICKEMHELMELVVKYSGHQFAAMLLELNIDTLHKDMAKRGATQEEMMTAAETFHDVRTFYGYDL